jgi:hypothetical protein
MKKIWVGAAFFVLVVVVILFCHPSGRTSADTGNAPVPVSTAAPPGIVSNNPANPGTTATVAGSSPGSPTPQAGELPPAAPVETNLPPIVILQNARRAIVQFAQVYGGNPVGVNSEITAALTGDNPKHINFVTPDSGLHVNARGEMVDAWGTPLFFHQISGHEMEIYSAGPDRIMWTYDDLVAR